MEQKHEKPVLDLSGENMKKLYKSRNERVISGVCGGIAEYFEVDPVLIRVLFVLFFFFGGSAILAYIIGIIIIPDSPADVIENNNKKTNPEIKTQKKKSNPGKNSLFVGLIFIILGIFFLMGQVPFLKFYYFWIRNNFWEILVPSILILIGFFIILSSRQNN
jgi:phage shock protein PspC (stress-responsive transcriptional regulator)